jgi:hypothetical protein
MLNSERKGPGGIMAVGNENEQIKLITISVLVENFKYLSNRQICLLGSFLFMGLLTVPITV